MSRQGNRRKSILKIIEYRHEGGEMCLGDIGRRRSSRYGDGIFVVIFVASALTCDTPSSFICANGIRHIVKYHQNASCHVRFLS